MSTFNPKFGKMKNEQHLPNLDGLRFIAAMAVVIFHLFTLHRDNWGDFFNSNIFLIIRNLTSSGLYGVNFFFVLSGFLITYIILKEIKTYNSFNIYYFLIRRSLRIWPLYFLVVIFGFYIFPYLPFGIVTKHELWRFLLFLSNFDEIINGKDDILNFLTITWSVSIEEQFYIFASLVIFLFKIRKVLKLQILFFSIIIVSILFRISNDANTSFLYYHTLNSMSDIAVGGLLSTLYLSKSKINYLVFTPKIVIISIYILGFTFLYRPLWFLSIDFFAIERLISGLFFAFIIAEQLLCQNSLFKADSIPYFKIGGKISYGLYMYHCIILYYLANCFSYLGWTNNLLGFIFYVIMTLLFTGILSMLSYKYFEAPILKLKLNYQRI